MNAGETLITRRTALGHAVNGVGALTLTSLLQNDLVAKPGIDARAAQFAPRAKRVIYLWMSGGPSQIDTFDPKPDINKLAKEKPNVTEAPFQFREHGQSGTEVSELLPHIAHHVDDLCVIRSMQGDTNTHEHAQTFTFTGVAQNKSPVPTLGNWVVYGLGCESKNLPALVSLGEMNPSPAEPYFLPAWTAGVMLRNKDKQKPGEEEPVVPNLNNAWLTREQQRRQLDLIQRLNRSHLQNRTTDDRLNARIESFERAFRMQVEATDAFDISGETEATKAAYGLGQAETAGYAERCMIARRLAERDVRFIVVPFSRPPKRAKPWRECLAGIHMSKTTSSLRYSANATINPLRRCWRILSNAACLRILWWCGEANLVAPLARAWANADVSITATVTPCSSPVAA